MMAHIYLDHNASTPMTPEVRAQWQSAQDVYGNPSAKHRPGLEARKLVEAARERLCDLLGASPSEMVFTSGGTEANITAVQSMIQTAWVAQPDQIPRIVLGAGEHPSLHLFLEQAERLKRVRVDMLPLDGNGHVPLSALDASLPGAQGLCLMWANNETGTLIHFDAIAQRVLGHGVPWHCDGVQGVGKSPLNLAEGAHEAITTLSLSGHKMNGPRGVGALYVRRNSPFSALFPGHLQEHGRRAGTENVAGISALGVAAQEAKARLAAGEAIRLQACRDALAAGLLEAFPQSRIHGDPESRLANTLYISLRKGEGAWIDGEEVALELAHGEIAVSTGAACESGSGKPSHVLLAMGCPTEVAHASLRFSFGVGNDLSEVPRVLEAVKGALC
jgi:cysteine desulfurase